MKRIALSVIAGILAVLLAFSLAGCQKSLSADTSCLDIMQAAVDATKAPGYQVIYELNDNFSATDMSLWADGVFEESKEFSLLKECAVYISDGSVAYEVAVLKAENNDDAEKLLTVLENRLETFSGGDKAAYDTTFEKKRQSVKIYTDGSFAIMLLTEDNAAAKKAIDALK